MQDIQAGKALLPDGTPGDGAGMPETEVVQVRIPGLSEYISVARQAVDAVGEQIRLSRDDRAAVKLAVGEACNNAVFHARSNAANGVGWVMVACQVAPDALVIDVTNQGNGFHPTAAVRMPAAEELRESGRGMALMEMLMDSVEYFSHHGNTMVRMCKRRAPEGFSERADAAAASLPA